MTFYNNKLFVLIAAIVLCVVVFKAGLAVGLSQSTSETSNTYDIQPDSVTINTTPTPEPKYVLCSDYVKITDRYKTPAGFYVVAKNETLALSEEAYNKVNVGYSAKIRNGVYLGGGYYQWYAIVEDAGDVKPVSETESGYRDACEVIK